MKVNSFKLFIKKIPDEIESGSCFFLVLCNYLRLYCGYTTMDPELMRMQFRGEFTVQSVQIRWFLKKTKTKTNICYMQMQKRLI